MISTRNIAAVLVAAISGILFRGSMEDTWYHQSTNAAVIGTMSFAVLILAIVIAAKLDLDDDDKKGETK